MHTCINQRVEKLCKSRICSKCRDTIKYCMWKEFPSCECQWEPHTSELKEVGNDHIIKRFIYTWQHGFI